MELLYFGGLRADLGFDRELRSLPASVGTVGALIRHLEGVYAPIRRGSRYLRVAIHETFVSAETAVHHGDRIAIMPPVAGG